jgi:release factor glutamine methyltransferase
MVTETIHPEGCRTSTRQVLNEGAQRLKDAGLEHARYEAEWLLGRLIGASPLEVYLREHDLTAHTTSHFFSQIEARASGVPFQYLLGEAEFFGERFLVRPGVFIPRPETEAIVERALQALRGRMGALGRALRVMDLGTGSGCIAVTLARELPTCVVVGVELSWEALRVARTNVLRHGLEKRLHLIQGRWLESFHGSVDGIVANPPYIPSARIDHLPLDVRQEPRISLDGGADGMRDLLFLLSEAPQVLAPGGVMVLESGEDQVGPLVQAARAEQWVGRVVPLQDLAKRPRGVLVVRRSA